MMITALQHNFDLGSSNEDLIEVKTQDGFNWIHWPLLEITLKAPLWECYADISEVAQLNPEMKLHGGHGYSVGNFHEFIVGSHLGREGTINILDSVVTLGKITPLGWLLYNGQEIDHIHGEIEYWDTIRLQNVKPENLEPTLLTALDEFSNSFGHSISIGSLEISEELAQIVERSEEPAQTVTILEKSEVATDVIPLRLFYFGKRHEDKIASFLQFYRILEYYSSTVGVRKLIGYRRSTDSDDAFAKAALDLINKREGESLLLLLDSLPTRMLALQAHQDGLTKGTSTKAFAFGLYKYRNSVVHAKEDFKDPMVVVSPIGDATEAAKWCIIVQTLAKMAITMFSTKLIKIR